VKLDGLRSDVDNLTTVLDGLHLQMFNCCRNSTQLGHLIQSGIGEYMSLVGDEIILLVFEIQRHIS